MFYLYSHPRRACYLRLHRHLRHVERLRLHLAAAAGRLQLGFLGLQGALLCEQLVLHLKAKTRGSPQRGRPAGSKRQPNGGQVFFFFFFWGGLGLLACC